MTDTPGTASLTPTLAGDHDHSHVQERETPFEHLAIRSVDQVHEFVDSRLSLESRPTPREVEEGFPHKLGRAFSRESHDHHNDPVKGEDEKRKDEYSGKEWPETVKEKEDILYVDWEEGDKRNPANFSFKRKWTITIIASSLTGLVAAVAATFAMGFSSMERDLNCTQFQATVSLAVYPLGFALFPLVLAPLSEEFGRQSMYTVSTGILLMMHVGMALAKNIQTVTVLRFLAGAAGSTGSTMVGGTIADIWAPNERGLPMGLFSIAAMASTGLGPVAAGWIEMNARLEWRWIQWFHVMVTAAMLVSIVVGMKETRSSVLLTRLARKLRKETGDARYRARIEDERASIKTLVFISCTRPLYLLVTEPVVSSFSVWVGFAWGILYVLIESISPAFKQLHGFNIGEVGIVYVAMAIGSLLGYFTNVFFQEKIYEKKFPTKGHEARLYSSMMAGVLFPVSIFIYAGCSASNVHWIGMCIAIVLFMWSIFMIYLAVFTYLADCYGPFASSAMAGQSLSRNFMGFVFPLFTTQMYDALTFRYANIVFACIALLLAPIPFILFRWGPQIRARSKFASQVPAFGS